MVKILLLLLRGRDADRSAIIGWWESSTCTRYDYRSRFEDRLIASSVDEELVVESREPRACRNHVSSPARKNTWWFHAIPLLEVGPPSSLLLFLLFLFDLSYLAMYSINFYRYPPSPLERKFAVSIVFLFFFGKMRREGGFVSDGSEEDGREVVRMVEGWDGIVKIVTHTRETEHTCERHDTPPSTTGFDDQYRHRGQTKRDVNSR